ncbi:MAG: site-2 protease family protein [Planctomycetota bacterium]
MSSFKIGNVFGIPVRIHATFLLLIYGVALLSGNPLEALVWLVVSFTCVLLHELGHSLVARAFGLHVEDITLWPLGGMARMSQIPENSRIEALIAIAGPAVNFLLAGGALLALTFSWAAGLAGPRAEHYLFFFVVANLVQGGFNLLPAFPMDGGRLLRALLGRKGDWVRATEIAARVGRWIAGLMFVASLALMFASPRSFCLLPLLSIFIWIAGARELLAVRLRHGQSPFGAAFAGGFRPAEASQAPPPPPPSTPEPPEGARRPGAWRREDVAPERGFSEDAIRRMERFRGPLRPPPPES